MFLRNLVKNRGIFRDGRQLEAQDFLHLITIRILRTPKNPNMSERTKDYSERNWNKRNAEPYCYDVENKKAKQSQAAWDQK